MEKYHPYFRLKVFNFLNDLRDSGEVNMYGARPYLVDEFDLDKKDSSELLSMYMEGSLYTVKEAS